MTTDVDDFLIHYGVKGMRWGVIRKDPSAKSNHQVHLEAHYIKKGLSKEDAIISAERRIKVEKVIAVAGAATVVAALAYAAGRYAGREFADLKLAEGTPLQHVTDTGGLKVEELPLFTTFNKADKRNIHALFPRTYQVDLVTKGQITAPSNFKARKMLSEVLGQKKVMSTSEYAKFNYRYFYDDSPESKKVVDSFFGKIKEAGYNSLLDPKPGGYAVAGVMRARLDKPLILLNGGNSAVKVGEKVVSETLRSKTQTKLLAKNSALSLGRLALPQSIAIGGGIGVGGALNYRMKVSAVDSYIQQHPTTTYTRSELAAMLVSNTSGYDVVVK